MLRKLHIRNYKSILDHEIELGRFNVFIGENGAGKTNVLEALAMASASLEGRLGPDEMYSKGIRIARPSVTLSSFAGLSQPEAILLRCVTDDAVGEETATVDFAIATKTSDDIAASWSDRIEGATATDRERKQSLVDSFEKSMPDPEASNKFLGALSSVMNDSLLAAGKRFAQLVEPSVHALAGILEGFVIFNLNIPALRGIQAQSRRAPVGIFGENLDVLIASFDQPVRDELLRRARLISWLDALEIDARDERKFQGYKLGRSTSTLYFRDRYMRPEENILSAENANEGILHVLFYLALFLSDKTPRLFGIDNIETALNPALCRELTRQLAELAAAHAKQALITTHNPAILDGLNLHDDEQRLFVVHRDDEGHTVTRRIRIKPDTDGAKHKLSEMWMRGQLGGIPKLF